MKFKVACVAAGICKWIQFLWLSLFSFYKVEDLLVGSLRKCHTSCWQEKLEYRILNRMFKTFGLGVMWLLTLLPYHTTCIIFCLKTKSHNSSKLHQNIDFLLKVGSIKVFVLFFSLLRLFSWVCSFVHTPISILKFGLSNVTIARSSFLIKTRACLEIVPPFLYSLVSHCRHWLSKKIYEVSGL
jgi:hypothetical protein